MTTIYNNRIPQKAVRELKIEQSRDKVPNQTSDKIILTYPLDKRYSEIVRNVSSTGTTAFTIFTTPRISDFYLTGIYMSHQCSSADDGTEISARIRINGEVINLLRFDKPASTAFNDRQYLEFSHPIKLDRSSIIDADTNATAGARITTVTITGYED